MPRENSNLPNSIDPLHLALAVCDWIGLRDNQLEPPDVLIRSAGTPLNASKNTDVFRADDFRNFAVIRRAARHAAVFVLVAFAAAVGRAQSQLPMYGLASVELERTSRPQSAFSDSLDGSAVPPSHSFVT